jgi:septum formation protein
MTEDTQLVLASQSPRRRDYMRQIVGEGAFVVAPANTDEQFEVNATPEQNAKRLSLEKAKVVHELYPDAIIIASDTIVAVAGEQLAKPADRTEAEHMLRRLAGRSTSVITGLAVLAPAREIVTSETTEVIFRPSDGAGVEEALQTYLASGDWADKAGAYGIQSGAGPLIAGIKGNYSVIVGLPVERLSQILQDEFGINTNQVSDVIPEGIASL